LKLSPPMAMRYLLKTLDTKKPRYLIGRVPGPGTYSSDRLMQSRLIFISYKADPGLTVYANLLIVE
jgi:hypothetical protein